MFINSINTFTVFLSGDASILFSFRVLKSYPINSILTVFLKIREKKRDCVKTGRKTVLAFFTVVAISQIFPLCQAANIICFN